MSFIEDDSVSNDDLQNLTTLVQEVELLDDEILGAEEHLKSLTQRRWRLVTESIPTMMNELGVEKLKIRGRELSLKMEYSGRIAQKNEEEAFKWLRDNGHEGIIRSYEKTQVHPQTLKAWIREQFQSGNGASIPEVFNPFAGQKAILTDKEKPFGR